MTTRATSRAFVNPAMSLSKKVLLIAVLSLPSRLNRQVKSVAEPPVELS